MIPSNSLVASAVRYSGSTARVYHPKQNWQAECYRHFTICGEARFAARFFGHALSRATLGVAVTNGNVTKELTSGDAYEYLQALFNGPKGQQQMLEEMGVHLTIAGECYLVGRKIAEENDVLGESDGEVWEVVSVLEMSVQGKKWIIKYGDGHPDIPLGDDDVVLRIWLPNPAKRIEADSPFRSLLPILTEIEYLTLHVFAQTQSRLAGAGVWVLPQGVTFPTPPDQEGRPPETVNEVDGLMQAVGGAMMRPLNDPGSPEALIPVMIQVPDETVDKIKEPIHFWSPLDATAKELRAEAITRFAIGMDLPPEQILGMSSSNGTGGGRSNGVSHWGAWQVEEATIKMFVEPMLSTLTNALTLGYLRPLTNDESIVTYSTAELRLRPDRSKEAFELYDRAVISEAAVLRENGFDPSDLMPAPEKEQWLLRRIAAGQVTPEQVGAALQLLGIDLPAPPEAQGVAPDAPGEARPQPDRAKPAPSLEDHPTRPRTPNESALLTACDALVYRALERIGNRLRANGVKPNGVRSFEMHTVIPTRGKEKALLDDAWSCAPEVLEGLGDPAVIVPILNGYVYSLMALQMKHSRETLGKWLAESTVPGGAV